MAVFYHIQTPEQKSWDWGEISSSLGYQSYYPPSEEIPVLRSDVDIVYVSPQAHIDLPLELKQIKIPLPITPGEGERRTWVLGNLPQKTEKKIRSHRGGHREILRNKFEAFFFIGSDPTRKSLLKQAQQWIDDTQPVHREEKEEQFFLLIPPPSSEKERGGEKLPDEPHIRYQLREKGIDPTKLKRVSQTVTKKIKIFDSDNMILSHPGTEDWLALLLASSPSSSSSSEEEGEIVGYAKGYRVSSSQNQNDSKSKEAHFFLIEISPAWRGKGLCPIFVAYIFRQLQSHGFDSISLLNVGGEVASFCYRKAAKLVGMEVSEEYDEMRFVARK